MMQGIMTSVLSALTLVHLYFGFALGDETVRLIPGPDRGRLEVLHEGSWGTVCQSSFPNKAASVVCRSLNQPSNNSYWVQGYVYGRGSLEPRLSRVYCTGQESSLSDCSLTTASDTSSSCSTSYIVGIVCPNEKMPALFKYGNTWFHSPQTVNIFEQDYIYCYAGNNTNVRGFQVTIRNETKVFSSATSYYRNYRPSRSTSGQLTCTVSNWQTTDMLKVSVNVMYPPAEFVKSVLIVFEGSRVNVTLTNLPNPLPYVTTWRKTGTRLTLNQSEVYRMHERISRDDGGEFLVNISNMMNSSNQVVKEGHGLELIFVDVQYKPTLQCDQEYLAAEGSEINITCRVESNPPPHVYIWTDSSGDIVYQGLNPSLIINSVGPENTGLYKCTAVNKMQDSTGKMESGVGLAELTIFIGDVVTVDDTRTVLTDRSHVTSTSSTPTESSSLTTVTYAMIGVTVVSLVVTVGLVIFIVMKVQNTTACQGVSSVRNTTGQSVERVKYEPESDYTNLEFNRE